METTMAKHLSRAELAAATRDFTDAFNDEDLDRVMGYFADDGVYDQFDGRPAAGRDAIRAAFAPQFAGAYGEMRFLDEDMFVDEAAQKTLISWECTLRKGERHGGWRGLDILHFQGGKIIRKLTYAKTEKPLLVKKGG